MHRLVSKFNLKSSIEVVFSTLLGISYLNTPITPGGLNYLSMEGGATLTITGSNMAQMSTMN